MSIKCSLLGHRFGETEVEREREEDGSEVVITITELETCTRCGETRVVSENKEVTTMETPADAGTTESSAPDLSGTTDNESDADEEPDHGDDAIILGEDEPSDAGDETTDSTASIPDAEADATTEDEAAEEDDAVILGSSDADASAEGSSGDPADAGDPPETADASERDATEQDEPEPGASGPGGTGADADDTDAESTTAFQHGDSSGEWPEETQGPDAVAGEDAMDDWPEETKRDVGEKKGAGPDLEETASPRITVPEGKFKCSACGFETEVESSSLRAGDFCPECHKGTLMQHEDAEE